MTLTRHDMWQQRFGASPAVLGRTIQLDDVPTSIIGVMPREFDFPASRVQLWTPAAFDDRDRQERRAHSWGVIARLQARVTIGRAEAEMNALAAAIAKEHPEHMTGWGVNLRGHARLRTALLVAQVWLSLLLLLGAALLVQSFEI